MTGLNASISISFLPVGHKIFSRLARHVVDGPVTQFNLLKEDTQIMEDELPNALHPRECQVKGNGTFTRR